jgi:hypothetical protein
MVEINTLVLPGSDIVVVNAIYINDRGEIAGNGILPNGDFHDVLLIPPSAEEIAAATALPATKAAPITNSPTTSTQGRLRHSQMLGAWRARLAQRYHIPGLGASPRD